jgi:hypothetical protein
VVAHCLALSKLLVQAGALPTLRRLNYLDIESPSLRVLIKKAT